MEAQTESAANSAESTTASTAPETAVSTPEVSSTPESQASSTTPPEGAQATQAAATTYTPTYKFKVMDKEHEIPEKWRALIKDAETEKEARELFEKAYGIEEVKKSRDGAKEEFKNYKAQAEPIVNTIKQASPLYQQAMQAFKEGNTVAGVYKAKEAFKLLGVDMPFLQKLVLEDINMQELPPEQKQSYNRAHELEQQNLHYQKQFEQMQQMYQQTQVQQLQVNLNQVMSKPDIAPLIQAFDQRNGQSAFYDEVIKRAQWYHYTKGVDITPEQAVNEIIKTYGLQAPAQQSTPQQVANQSVPVIPAVKGGTQSPAHKAIRSLADLEKIRAEKNGY